MRARELEGGATRETPRHSLFRCLEDKEERAGRADPCVCVCVSSCINNRNGALPEGPLPFQSILIFDAQELILSLFGARVFDLNVEMLPNT